LGTLEIANHNNTYRPKFAGKGEVPSDTYLIRTENSQASVIRTLAQPHRYMGFHPGEPIFRCLCTWDDDDQTVQQDGFLVETEAGEQRVLLPEGTVPFRHDQHLQRFMGTAFPALVKIAAAFSGFRVNTYTQLTDELQKILSTPYKSMTHWHTFRKLKRGMVDRTQYLEKAHREPVLAYIREQCANAEILWEAAWLLDKLSSDELRWHLSAQYWHIVELLALVTGSSLNGLANKYDRLVRAEAIELLEAGMCDEVLMYELPRGNPTFKVSSPSQSFCSSPNVAACTCLLQFQGSASGPHSSVPANQ
jgi:hypothetical protein